MMRSVWETFRIIEEITGETKTGLAGYEIEIWIDGVFRGTHFLQEERTQQILKSGLWVETWKVWEKTIFLTLLTNEGRRRDHG